jgi:transmembrane sensor
MSKARCIELEAAEWLSRRVDPSWSTDDQLEFERWLENGLGHRAAYWRLEEGWERAGRMVALGAPLPNAARPQTSRRRGWIASGAAAAMAAAAFVGVTQLRQDSQTPRAQDQVLATPVGGHKIVSLDDGSAIELNTATLVRAAVAAGRREVWLDRGEAFFNVLHSATVPFVVHAGPKDVTVLGTKFSVHREGDKVTVVVESGRVRVTDAKASTAATETYVAAGSVAVIRPDATLVTQSAPENVEADLAWRHGQLAFRNDTLADAAAEFNRYNERKLVVVGEAAGLKISGGFKSSNEDGFARLLRDAYGLNVTVSEGEIRVSD